MKKTISIIAIMLIVPMMVDAKGGVGGARGGGSSGARSSASSSRSSTSVSSKSATTTKAAPSKPSVSKSPTSTTKTTTASAPKTVAGKSFGTKGYVVGDGYSPSFRGGYTAPAGSTVYYRDSSVMDWLPFYMIMSSDNAHREAVVVQPDGKEEVVKEEGIDTMYVINWIITILFVLGIVICIVYIVNKLTKKEEYAY